LNWCEIVALIVGDTVLTKDRIGSKGPTTLIGDTIVNTSNLGTRGNDYLIDDTISVWDRRIGIKSGSILPTPGTIDYYREHYKIVPWSNGLLLFAGYNNISSANIWYPTPEVLFTTDGINFKRMPNSPVASSYNYALPILNSNKNEIIYVVTDHVYKSSNGGLSWIDISRPYGSSQTCYSAIDNFYIQMVQFTSSPPSFTYTTDGGYNWNWVNTSGSPYTADAILIPLNNLFYIINGSRYRDCGLCQVYTCDSSASLTSIGTCNLPLYGKDDAWVKVGDYYYIYRRFQCPTTNDQGLYRTLASGPFLAWDKLYDTCIIHNNFSEMYFGYGVQKGEVCEYNGEVWVGINNYTDLGQCIKIYDVDMNTFKRSITCGLPIRDVYNHFDVGIYWNKSCSGSSDVVKSAINVISWSASDGETSKLYQTDVDLGGSKYASIEIAGTINGSFAAYSKYNGVTTSFPIVSDSILSGWTYFNIPIYNLHNTSEWGYSLEATGECSFTTRYHWLD